MFKVFVKYPSFDDEFSIAKQTTSKQTATIEPVLSGEEMLQLQEAVREVPVGDHLVRYALSLVRQTRVGHEGIPDYVSEMAQWGAGPRAVQFLLMGAKTRALLYGRSNVALEDIQSLAKPVLRHRVVMSFAAESDGVTSDTLIDRIIDDTPSRENDLLNDARFQKIFAS